MIRFGMWSTILALSSLHGLVVAGLLARAKANGEANRVLAALLVVMALTMTPYTLGYAGCYDAWPWLTFAPFFWQLALGPLLWRYVVAMATASRPRRWLWHLAPAALQGLYYVVLFLQPLPIKQGWYLGPHAAVVVPLQWALVALSATAYWIAAGRVFLRWQRWLKAHSAAAEEYRLTWLRRFLGLTGAVIVVGMGFALWDVAVRRVSYFDAFGLYLSVAALVYVLGVEGWRHADVSPPRMPHSPVPAAPTPTVDWHGRARAWTATIEREGWYREPELTLATVARRLGTNPAYLSRGLNEGLGTSFSTVINRMRVDAACVELARGGAVLFTALDVGFGSKATFNRVFRQVVGCTPSAYRTQAGRGLIAEISIAPREPGTS
jgi:AraC-like DNA-binding protein